MEITGEIQEANVADYCLRNHVAAMDGGLCELTLVNVLGYTFWINNLARTQYKSFDSVCCKEDVKEAETSYGYAQE